MILSHTIYRAPPESGDVILGRTLPSLLDQACDRYPNPHALNQWTEQGWQPLSTKAFRTAAEELALGLSNLDLKKGDRVALLMHSDTHFCIADMSCLLAALVNVPIDLTQTIENIIFILQHTAAKALIISDLDLLYQVVPYLWETPKLQTVIVAKVPDDWQETRSHLLACPDEEETHRTHKAGICGSVCLRLPVFLCHARTDQPCPPPPFPQCIQLLSLEEVQVMGRNRVSSDQLQQLRAEIAPDDLATIIYTASESGSLRGAMLTHQNISADILAAFAATPELQPGVPEVILSFLPLTHVFARAFLYGHINYGHRVYLTTPSRVTKHLREIQPTLLITVPRLLEKVHETILSTSRQLKGFSKLVYKRALYLAQRYEVGQRPTGAYARELKMADQIVYSQWRAAFGGRVKYLISGGASLSPELTNFFWAAGIPVLQGYGLTETSSVLCYNRGAFNRAGTVGVPIAGVEMAIARDREILVRAPYVMQGYYKNPEATREAIDSDGWFHTGDRGEFTPDGFLKLTGCKKNLFKLSTGKYVTPLPLENQLNQSSLVERAIVVGAQRKFCSLLLVPHLNHLRVQAHAQELDLPTDALLQHPQVLALYQALVDAANRELPHWSKVKRFRLIQATLTVKNGLLTRSRTLNRTNVYEALAGDIDALYAEAEEHLKPKAKPPIRRGMKTWYRRLRNARNLMKRNAQEHGISTAPTSQVPVSVELESSSPNRP